MATVAFYAVGQPVADDRDASALARKHHLLDKRGDRMSTVVSRCTSGRAMPDLGVSGSPCNTELVIVNSALLCPKCDNWPGRNRK